MPKSSFAVVTIAYALGAFGRTLALMTQRWEAGLPIDSLIGGSIADSLSWPVDLITLFL